MEARRNLQLFAKAPASLIANVEAVAIASSPTACRSAATFWPRRVRRPGGTASIDLPRRRIEEDLARTLENARPAQQRFHPFP